MTPTMAIEHTGSRRPSMGCTPTGFALRVNHLARFLAEFDPTRGPMDLAWRAYSKRNPVLGSKDRQWIADRIYLHEKRRSLFEALAPGDWQQRAEWLASWPDLPASKWEQLTEAQRQGLPQELWELLVREWGPDKAEALAATSLGEAPLFLRTNCLKIARPELLELLLQEKLAARLCEQAPFGIRLPPRTPVTRLESYQKGYFEIQDEGSQMVASLCAAQPGDEVLDYCAGAGGKALAIACGMEGKGQIFLHDVRTKALAEARIRLRRAGVQNGQTVEPASRGLRLLRGRCDWVICDVPCSGTGTLRRNPDMKWRFRSSALQELVVLQREIVQQASLYLKPGGRLVYATCSVLPQENQQQRAWLEENGWKCLREWSSFPEEGEMDGLYGAVLERS